MWDLCWRKTRRVVHQERSNFYLLRCKEDDGYQCGRRFRERERERDRPRHLIKTKERKKKKMEFRKSQFVCLYRGALHCLEEEVEDQINGLVKGYTKVPFKYRLTESLILLPLTPSSWPDSFQDCCSFQHLFPIFPLTFFYFFVNKSLLSSDSKFNSLNFSIPLFFKKKFVSF